MGLPMLQKFLGHKNIQSTARYLHARAEDVAAVIQTAVGFDVAATDAPEGRRTKCSEIVIKDPGNYFWLEL